MKFLTASMLLLDVFPLVVVGKKRRVPFMLCPSTKSNSGLLTVKPARSKIECSVICLNDPDCLSASYCKNPDGYTCQLSSFYAAGTCTGHPADDDCTQTAMVSPCENGGTFYTQNRTCHCLEGFIGDYCQRRYRDCDETPGGNMVYQIQPLGSDYIFEWKCYYGYDVTTLWFAYNLNCTRKWEVMKSGLPILPASFFFLGLESLHQLTKQGTYDMSVTLTIQGKDRGQLWYRNFHVDSEAEGYALHWDHAEKNEDSPFNSGVYLDGFGGAGDASKNLNGARFGTHDRDVNDCAKVKNIGWWYNPLGCTILDFAPNGVYWPTNRSGIFANKYMHIFKIRIELVHMYVEDDLVF